MVSAELTQLLLDLTQQAQALANTESLEEYQRHAKDVCRAYSVSLQQLSTVRGQFPALNSNGWQELADEGVVVVDATKVLNALMRYGSATQACAAAVVYSWLLRSPDAPVHNMLDALTFSSCLQRIKESVFAKAGTSSNSSKAKGKAAATQQQDASDADDEDAAAEAGPSSSHSALQAVSAADYELSLCLCFETLMNLAAMMQQVQLRSNEEILTAGLEGCTDFLSCTKSAKVPTGSKGLGLMAGSISTAAYALLEALFSPRHGSMEDMAAVLLPRLTPLMVGAAVPAAGKRSASDLAATRTAAVSFVRGAYSRHPEIQEAVAALARHICLTAQDKADSRTAAIKACAELVTDLPQWEQEQFVGFAYNLSRTKQLGLRTLSVGLANNLLMNLPEPFKHSTFAAAQAAAEGAAGSSAATSAVAAAAGVRTATPAPTRVAGAGSSGHSVPEGMVVAPWSVVALAALLHRCSDKSAVVRGRALSDLAEVVDCFSSLLSEDPDSEQHQVAEAFVEGLEAAAALQVLAPKQPGGKQQQQPRKRPYSSKGNYPDSEDDAEDDEEYSPSRRRRAGASAAADEAADGAVDADEDGGEQAEGGAADDRVQHNKKRKPSAVFTAYMPGQLTADLNPVTSLVHRRCGDPKAAVRKGALQLLEALLVMRASWQGYPRQLPGSADLALLEAATADPLVSVRKAALIALSTLLELFPAEPSLCQAWVASGLPLVRDVEVAIQDSLADWSAALLFDKAAAVGSTATRKGYKKAAAAEEMDWQAEAAGTDPAAAAAAAAGGAASGATANFTELRQLLAAVAGVGRAAGACLGKLCAGMAAKKKLKAGAIARGLEAVIAGTPAGSPPALGAWILLKELATQDASAPSWKFLQQRWAAVRATAAGAGYSAAQHALGTIHEGSEGLEASGSQLAGSSAVGLADEAASLLLVISQTAAGFPREQAEELAAELLQHILSFHLPPTAAGAHVAALFKLTEAAAGSSASSAAAGAPVVWAKQVYAAAHERLRRYIDIRSGSAVVSSDATLDHTSCVAMFTIGEVALLKSAKPPGGLTVLLQALTAHNFIPSAASASQYYSSSQAPQGDAAVSAGFATQEGADGSSGLPSAHMLATQAIYAGGTQSGTQLMGGTQGVPLTQAVGGNRAVPSCVQGHAWIALGKVCLVDEGLAKKCVPLFVQELGRSPYPVVRNNIMVALSDMLIQYTALVDAHMPRLASCLRDRHELVRRQALALLANLLMKDYVKWRGPLFHRFLLALVDPSPAVRQLAEYLLKDVIAIKAPLLAYNHFVEALFVLNGCTAGLHGARLGASMGSGSAGGSGGIRLRMHGDMETAGNGEQQPEGDGMGVEGAARAGGEDEEGDEDVIAAPAQFTLKGKHKRASRDIIYSALLRSMTPEHKFSSAAKLCGEVLAGVADGLLPLVECEEVLRDALCLLASKDIKVSANRLAAHDEDELPATQGGSAGAGGSATAVEAAARARGKLVSALMKRHLVEQVVPVLVELRRLLAEVKHPLLAELMACFAALLKEYKGEVEDILVADKQLAKEILYDIKQAELLKTQQQQQLQQPAAPGQLPAAAREAPAAARRSPPPAGVMPGTPVAAEVLATAERQRREQLQQLRMQQQEAAAAGDMPAPPPRLPGQLTPGSSSMQQGAAAGAVLQTPAAVTASKSRLAGSSTSAAAGEQPPGTAGRATAAGVFKTPAAKTPGSAAAGTGTAGRAVMASPAPLTVTKTGSRVQRPSRADENQEPGSAGTGVPTVSRKAAELLQRSSPSQATNILLPSPYRTTPSRQWNIPQHVATGEKQQQQQTEQEEGGKVGRGGRGIRGAKATAAVDGDGAAAAGGSRSGRQRRQIQQQHGADDDGAAAAAAVVAKAAAGSGGGRAAGSSRRATRGQKDAATADDGAVAVKVEKGSDAVEPSTRRAATRKRRNV